MNAAVQEKFTGPMDAIPSTARTPLERAQDLVYRAFDARGRRRVQLARKAIELSADCADAYVLLAEECADLGQARDLYAQGVAAGERALGPAFFAEDAGHFWQDVRTRPYLRARFGWRAASMTWVNVTKPSPITERCSASIPVTTKVSATLFSTRSSSRDGRTRWKRCSASSRTSRRHSGNTASASGPSAARVIPGLTPAAARGASLEPSRARLPRGPPRVGGTLACLVRHAEQGGGRDLRGGAWGKPGGQRRAHRIGS